MKSSKPPFRRILKASAFGVGVFVVALAAIAAAVAGLCYAVFVLLADLAD